MSRGRRDERGQTTVLLVGFFLVAVLLVVVVVDSSAAFLMRQRLDAVADGAALAAADGVQGEQVYEGGLGERAEIDPVVARKYVAEYLARIGAGRDYPGLVWRVSTTPTAVNVEVSSALDLPLVPPGWTGDSRVSGRSAAYVVVSD